MCYFNFYRLVNQKPIVSYSLTNYNGNYATVTSTLSISCTHPITCKVVCRLYEADQSTESVNFATCASTPFRTVQNSLRYVYEIQASDSVNNTADLIQIRFTADTQPPTLVSPLAAYSGDCGDDLNSAVTPPALVDNFDASPRSSFTDRKLTSCSIRRDWLATDHVNNSAVYPQTISLTPNSVITYPDTFNLSCVTNSQVLKVRICSFCESILSKIKVGFMNQFKILIFY